MIQEVERELAVTKDCSHPNVVQIVGLMVGPGRIGIVMELCDTSLAKRIKEQDPQKPVPWGENVRFLMDGAAGLAFIHTHKSTIHGDVKPDNLLIQQDRLKVADFGLATVRRTMTKFTGEVSRKGTGNFMAPERLIGKCSAGAEMPIDVWGFGCVIANVVTGEIPYDQARNEQDLLLALRRKSKVFEERHVHAGCPKELLCLIEKCCQHDPAKRPTMQEVERELRCTLQSIQVIRWECEDLPKSHAYVFVLLARIRFRICTHIHSLTPHTPSFSEARRFRVAVAMA